MIHCRPETAVTCSLSEDLLSYTAGPGEWSPAFTLFSCSGEMNSARGIGVDSEVCTQHSERQPTTARTVWPRKVTLVAPLGTVTWFGALPMLKEGAVLSKWAELEDTSEMMRRFGAAGSLVLTPGLATLHTLFDMQPSASADVTLYSRFVNPRTVQRGL